MIVFKSNMQSIIDIAMIINCDLKSIVLKTGLDGRIRLTGNQSQVRFLNSETRIMHFFCEPFDLRSN